MMLPSSQFLYGTTSICQVCKNGLPAQVVERPGNEIWMEKTCQQHGPQQVKLSNNAEWYKATRKGFPAKKNPPQKVQKQVNHGCPFDCGPCKSHEQKIRLPVVTINSACNLDCPICYVHNKNDDPFNMKFEDFKKVVDHLRAEHGSELDILNLTGGEPTMHPNFLDYLEYAKNAGVHRVTICTNGIRFVRNKVTLERLAQIGARVALSFDSFEREADTILQGAKLLDIKLKCLDMLEKYNVNTTLIPVMTKGINDHEIGKMIELLFARPNIRHLEVHTMTYTGQGGKNFDRSGRISMHEVLERIEQTTAGLLKVNDFVSSPCAHPLCYQIAYLLVDQDGGFPVPFTRFMSRDDFYGSLSDRLYLESNPNLEKALHEAIYRLWVDSSDEARRILKMLKRLLTDLFPEGRPLTREESLRVGEQSIKAIYIHSHMDEENFDTERASQCCDSNCYPDGTSIPVCNYNVLYREKEDKFNIKPLLWNERSGGQKHFPLAELER